MNIQSIAAVPSRNHGLAGIGVADRDAAHNHVSNIGRVSLSRFAWFVVGYNIAVIVWGAYVRATKSGEGCGSHWPLCNAEVLPTTLHIQTAIEFSHRVTSGVSLVLVAILLIWCWCRTAKGDRPRYSAVAAAMLLFFEALFGALLVLVDRLGGFGQSTTHALLLCLHFGNTLCLLAALALTARWTSSGPVRSDFVRKPDQLLATGLGLLSIMIIGISGSLASLGDTIFPPDSLRHAFLEDFSSSGPVLLRLRALHPIAAIIGSVYVLWLLRPFWQKKETSAWLSLIPFTLTVQIVLGALNVILLAPIWLQMTHLLVAEIFWILLVLASSEQLFPIQNGL
jgi:cytochrome c oxidase assembly protein subunit 15